MEQQRGWFGGLIRFQIRVVGDEIRMGEGVRRSAILFRDEAGRRKRFVFSKELELNGLRRPFGFISYHFRVALAHI